MALDTAAKRFAVAGVGRPWMRSQKPNSAKDVAWRVSTGQAYPIGLFDAAVTTQSGVSRLRRSGFREDAERERLGLQALIKREDEELIIIIAAMEHL